jgi:hypothetical protein
LCFFFESKELVHEWLDFLSKTISKNGLFYHAYYARIISFCLLLISNLGAKGKKSIKLKPWFVIRGFLSFVVVYFYSEGLAILFFGQGNSVFVYAVLLVFSWLGILTFGTLLYRLIQNSLSADIFNKLNKTFP